MSRDNVKRVLVTSGNQAVAAAGTIVDNLALGQVGVFDAETQLAIDATSTPKDFYLAVGIDTDGEGVMNDIKVSAGQHIQAANLRSYEFRPHTAGRPQIVTIGGIAAPVVGDEYAVRIEFLNARIARRMGRVQFSHTYAVVAETTSAEDLADAIVASINANDDGFVSAAAGYSTSAALTVATDSTSIEYAAGAPITVAGDIVIARDKGTLVADVVLTTKPLAANGVKNLNLRYFDLRETNIIVSLVEGFTSTATVTTTQEVVYEEGNAGQIRQLEYHETGLADPYVLSEVTGTARDLQYSAVAGVKYDQFTMEYDFFSVAGWLEHLNNLQTTVAVPATDTVTRNALVDIIDAQFEAKGFDGKSEVAKSSNVDPAVIEKSDDDLVQV